MTTCQCVDVATAARLAFGGLEQPHCEQHDPPTELDTTTLALNDDAGLTAVISRAIGAPVNTANPTQPLDAA